MVAASKPCHFCAGIFLYSSQTSKKERTLFPIPAAADFCFGGFDYY
jgi:hypothetical protein